MTQPVCTIIPPHIFDHMAKSGDPRASAVASETLAHLRQMKAQREEAFLAPPAVAVAPPHRNVYDAAHELELPGALVMTDRRKRGRDVEVNEAFDGSGATAGFYAGVFGRQSVDGRGMRLDSSVHYGVRFDNAMWNGRQMIYGDGDGEYFNRFTAAVDVIGHELTHGVIQCTAALRYEGESGALNEHIADAFGIMVKQHALRQTAETSDWIIGAGLFARSVHGKGVRSMAAPGTAYDDPILGRDPQPAHMRDYVHTADDNGGVHINSGIPNHAFYLAAVAMGGDVWDSAGRIWYETLTTRIHATTRFAAFAKATLEVAQGFGARARRAVADAWGEVGIGKVRAAA